MCTLNIVLGRGGGGDKSVHVPLHTQKQCTLIACHRTQCTLNIVLAGAGVDSAHTVAGVCARVLQLPDKTSYCCTHAVATYKCSAYALLLVRVRTSKSSSLRVGNKSFGSRGSTYACETYDLLWYNKSKYIAKCKINSCNASMTSCAHMNDSSLALNMHALKIICSCCNCNTLQTCAHRSYGQNIVLSRVWLRYTSRVWLSWVPVYGWVDFACTAESLTHKSGYALFFGQTHQTHINPYCWL